MGSDRFYIVSASDINTPSDLSTSCLFIKMMLKYGLAAVCLMAAGSQALTEQQISDKADFDAKRNSAKAKRAEEIAARQDEIAAKEAERQAKHEEWWARVSKIIQKLKEKENYKELKALQVEQKKNFALQKALDLANKREQHKHRQQQQADRLILKELRKIQKEAWKQLNALQKSNYEQLDAQQKQNWAVNRAQEIATFNQNVEDWETEDQRQKAVWNQIMGHQQLHWAAKVSGLYEGGSQCSMPGNDFNPLWAAEDFENSLNYDSYDSADVHVGAVSFAHTENGSFYVLVSTDTANALYEVHANVFAGQEGLTASSGYSEHSKARNFQKVDNVETIGLPDGSYQLKLVGISDVDGSQYNWAICFNQ